MVFNLNTRLKVYLSNNNLKLLSGLLICSIIVFSKFIFGNHIYLFNDVGSDSLDFYYPVLIGAKNYIEQYHILSWSFQAGMGQNILPMALNDPFDLIILSFNKDIILELLVYKEIVKIILTGFIFYKFLLLIKINVNIAAIGAFLCAFSGYMIVGSAWFIFSFNAFSLIFLFWSFEILIQKNNWHWFPLSIALICAGRTFDLWIWGFFLFTYFILRLDQKVKSQYKLLLKLMFKCICLAILGMCLASPLMFEHIYSIVNSPRGSGDYSFFNHFISQPLFSISDRLQLGTVILRSLSSDILGTGNAYKGWYNYLEAPALYCGTVCLLVFPQILFFNKKKIKHFVFITIWFLPLLFPFLRYSLWLYTGDYYRNYSLIVTVIILTYSLKSLDTIINERKLNVKTFIASYFILIIIILFFKNYKPVNTTNLLLIFCFATIVFFSIYYYIKINNSKQTYNLIFLILIIETICLSWITINNRIHFTKEDITSKIGYNDYTNEAVNHLKKTDPTFYRINKKYSSSPSTYKSFNDALIQGYYGTSCYNSFNHINYINYLKSNKIISKSKESESRWSKGLENEAILESINSVKYTLVRNYNSDQKIKYFDSLTTINDITILKNMLVLPLGFGYTKYFQLSNFETLKKEEQLVVNLNSCVIDTKDTLKVKTKINVYSDLNNKITDTITCLKSLQQNTFNITSFRETNIVGNIKLDKNCMMYFSIPYDNGWKVEVNNKEHDKFKLSNGMTGILLSKGEHQINLSYQSIYMKTGLYTMLIAWVIYFGLIINCLFLKRITYN